MKKIMKLMSVILTLAVLTATFAACSSKPQKESEESKTLKIGVIQYMSHPSLDNCYNGIKQALEASGLKYDIDFQMGSNTSADSDCASFARNMVSNNYDIIIAIATPAAKAAFNATNNTNIPVIFCAVSDPVAAKLVEKNEAPGYLCTGTSDVLNLDAQVDMIQAMQPGVKSIGILYTSSEDNSLTNLANFKKICEGRNIEVVAKAVQSASDVPSAAEDLASKVDCINNFTDNNVVNNLATVLSAADKNNIPVYGSEIEQVKNGCLSSVSIDYIEVGKATGNMAVDVLKGADAKTMAVKIITDTTPVVNDKVLAKLKMTMPTQYTNATIVSGS